MVIDADVEYYPKMVQPSTSGSYCIISFHLHRFYDPIVLHFHFFSLYRKHKIQCSFKIVKIVLYGMGITYAVYCFFIFA